jgi:hypothetical protein
VTLALAGTFAILLFAGWAFASPATYPLLERTLGLASVQRVQTSKPEVGLLVEASQSAIPALARTLTREGLHGSFVISDEPAPAVLRAAARAHDGLLATAAPTGIGKMLRFRTQVVDVARPIQPRGRFYYLAPAGVTLADYIAVRAAGGYPVSPSLRLDGRETIAPQRGMIVLVDAESAPWTVEYAAARLSSAGLRAVTLGELLSSGAERESHRAPPPTSTSPVTSPVSSSGSDGHASFAIAGASATGTNVVNAKTTGPTWATRRCRSADISLRVPRPAATFIAANQNTAPAHACPA